MWILYSVWKMMFPSIRGSFQKRKYVIFLGIGEILEKGVHESSVCDTSIYRFPDFHIFKQFPFQIPYNLDHFFQFPITINNSFLPFQFPYPSIFATCYPFPEIFTSFPFPPKPCQLSLLSVRSFVFADIFYINIYSTKSYTIAFDLLLLWMLLPSNFEDENIF